MAQQEQQSVLTLGIVGLDSKQGSLLLCLQMAALRVAVLAQQACTVELSTACNLECWLLGRVYCTSTAVCKSAICASKREMCSRSAGLSLEEPFRKGALLGRALTPLPVLRRLLAASLAAITSLA